MPTISYRDALNDIITDKEELEFLLEYLDMHKNWGAFRTPRLPSHTLVTLIDAVKRLKEQQLFYVQKHGEIAANDEDAFEKENGPDAELA